MRRVEIRVRGLVLAVLLPSLMLVTLAFGWITYRALQDEILAGFDGLLVAVGTVTGSFVDPADHADLLQARSLGGLARVPGAPYLVGIDREVGELVAVDRVQGGARRLAPVPADSLTGLTAVDGGLVSRHARLGWVVVDTASGALTPIRAGTLPASLTRPPVDGPLRDAAFHPTTGRARLLAGSPPALLAPAAGGAAADVLPVAHPPETEGGRPLDGLTSVAFDEDGNLFVAGDRLVRVDPATGRVLQDDYMEGFRTEAHPAYQAYVRPMRRIARRTNLTYLYTQVLDDDGTITYGLDATEGEDHTPVGGQDVLPPADLPGALRVLSDGSVYITGVQRWEQWGLLKSAFAPIGSARGPAPAMAGADVNISIISEKTRRALAVVGFLGVVGLALGTVVSLWFSRTLTTPTTLLEDGALRLAAGELGVHVRLPALRELNGLTDAFNTMSVTAEQRIAGFRARARELDGHRIVRTLALESGDPSGDDLPPRVSGVRRAGSTDPSGVSPLGDSGAPAPAVLVWLADPSGDPARDLDVRTSMARMARRMRPDHPDEVLGLLPGLAVRGVHTVAVRRPDGSVRVRSDRPDAVSIAGDGAARADVPPPGSRRARPRRSAEAAAPPSAAAGATAGAGVLDVVVPADRAVELRGRGTRDDAGPAFTCRLGPPPEATS